jgi:hypothetical protein
MQREVSPMSLFVVFFNSKNKTYPNIYFKLFFTSYLSLLFHKFLSHCQLFHPSFRLRLTLHYL